MELAKIGSIKVMELVVSEIGTKDNDGNSGYGDGDDEKYGAAGVCDQNEG